MLKRWCGPPGGDARVCGRAGGQRWMLEGGQWSGRPQFTWSNIEHCSAVKHLQRCHDERVVEQSWHTSGYICIKIDQSVKHLQRCQASDCYVELVICGIVNIHWTTFLLPCIAIKSSLPVFLATKKMCRTCSGQLNISTMCQNQLGAHMKMQVLGM